MHFAVSAGKHFHWTAVHWLNTSSVNIWFLKFPGASLLCSNNWMDHWIYTVYMILYCLVT